MAKTVCKLLGVVFLIVGIAGFVKIDLFGTHLNMAHNLVHILSGIIALYFGFAGSVSGARGFSLVFGAVYLLLGILGFVLGKEGKPTLAGMETMATDSRLWEPGGILALGTADHAVHLLLGVVFLIGALLTKSNGARSD